MSIPVPLERLRAATDERGGSAFLLTVSDDGRPHAVHVAVHWAGEVLAADVGSRSARNAAARPAVSLLWPGRSRDDYSLIVDGTAAPAALPGANLAITPIKGVLHRPAAAPDPGAACGADCVPLLPGARDRG